MIFFRHGSGHHKFYNREYLSLTSVWIVVLGAYKDAKMELEINKNESDINKIFYMKVCFV